MEVFGYRRFLDQYVEFTTPQMSGLVEKIRSVITVIHILFFFIHHPALQAGVVQKLGSCSYAGHMCVYTMLLIVLSEVNF